MKVSDTYRKLFSNEIIVIRSDRFAAGVLKTMCTFGQKKCLVWHICWNHPCCHARFLLVLTLLITISPVAFWKRSLIGVMIGGWRTAHEFYLQSFFKLFNAIACRKFEWKFSIAAKRGRSFLAERVVRILLVLWTSVLYVSPSLSVFPSPISTLYWYALKLGFLFAHARLADFCFRTLVYCRNGERGQEWGWQPEGTFVRRYADVDICVNLYYAPDVFVSRNFIEMSCAVPILLRTYCGCHASVLSRLCHFESGVSPKTDDPFGFPIVYEDVFPVSILHLHRRSFPGSAILGKCSIGWRLRPDERFQFGSRPVQECRAEDRETLGGSESCLPSGGRAYCEEREGGKANDEAKEKERRALRGSRKRTVARPVAN